MKNAYIFLIFILVAFLTFSHTLYFRFTLLKRTLVRVNNLKLPGSLFLLIRARLNKIPTLNLNDELENPFTSRISGQQVFRRHTVASFDPLNGNLLYATPEKHIGAA